MTSLPTRTARLKLGLVIDLDICVACQACAVNCKEWNTSGQSAPLTDLNPYGAEQNGVWYNRVHSFEVVDEKTGESQTVNFPKSCLHCEDAPCVTVCPTGASYKRSEDGIVLVNGDICIGCKLCSWACPYGAREYDEVEGVMKKCTLCVDKIYNDTLSPSSRVPACVSTCPVGARHFGDLGDPHSEVSHLVRARGGFALMPEQGTLPVNRYLPPRPKQHQKDKLQVPRALEHVDQSSDGAGLLARWADKILTGKSAKSKKLKRGKTNASG